MSVFASEEIEYLRNQLWVGWRRLTGRESPMWCR